MSKTVKAMKSWLERIGLTLAVEKTEAVLIANCRKKNTLKVEIGGYKVFSKRPSIRRG